MIGVRVHLWRNGRPTEYGVEVYTEGDCWVLSYHLAKKLNTKVALIGAKNWGHAVVPVPGTKKYLDIEGLHTKNQLLNNHNYTHKNNKGILHVPVTDGFKTYIDNICFDYDPGVFDKMYDVSDKTAKRIADRLISKHLGVS